MEYTTLVWIKAYLGITDTSSDTTLTKIIKIVTEQFDKFLGRNLETDTYEEYFDFNSEKIVLTKYPIIDLLELKENNTDGSDLSIKRTWSVAVYLEGAVSWDIFIKYTAWYDDLSDIPDVEQACLEVCTNMWKTTPASWNLTNIKSEKVWELSQSFFSKDEMAGWINFSYKTTLKNYKPINPQRT